MLAYAVLGVALVLAVMVIGRLFVIANPTVLARIAKWSLIAIAVIGAVYLLLRGQTAAAGVFGGIAAVVWRVARMVSPWAMFRIWQSARAYNRSRRYTSGRGTAGGNRGGGASAAETAWLSMSLDHASGAMDGTILQGPFAGRRLSALDRDEVFALFLAVRGDDPRSVQLVEAFLNREHGDWQEDYEKFEAAAGGAPGGDGSGGGVGPMTRAEALDVLGLDANASEAEIKEAHRRLMMHSHPDQGGTDYLAAKINQAKEVLLDK